MRTRWIALLGCVAATACGRLELLAADDASAPAVEAGAPDAAVVVEPCADAGVPPATLECAGLYSNFAEKTLSSSALAYAPAVPLWSDGAGKDRWIELPPGTTIDRTNPNEWVFPVGTKLFKQFTYAGRRVETRLFQKVTSTYWVHATYAWNEAESATRISYGESVPVDSDGGAWVIPTPTDCDSCHRGRTDRILGFEEVSLGLSGATGLTLPELVARGLVTPPPAATNLRIGDGTGLDAPALAWLHVNCGVSCHNANENAQGFGAKMILRLDPGLLDGTPPSATWDPLRTTLGVACVSGTVAGQTRIVAGVPTKSVVVELMSERGALQMPPLATRFVDNADVAVVTEWIRQMSASDAGPRDGGRDGPSDAGSDDGGDDAM